MAVELHAWDTWLPSKFLPNEDVDDIVSETQDNDNNNNNNSSALKPPVQGNDKEDDFIDELTHRMAHFMLQDDDTFDFSDIISQTHNLELGSPEGSSQEPSSPATPEKGMIGMFEKMNLDERGNSKLCSNIELCSYQTLIQEQIRSIELSRLNQDHVLSPKSQGQPKKQIQQIHKKGKGGGNGRRTREPQQQTGSGMRAVFLDGPGSRGGTGVFLPSGGTSAPYKSTNKPGKGCSTVLIPARVVQALQLHFEQMAAKSGPKTGGFPALNDVLVSNSDGMYSLQKRKSQKAPKNIQSEMILPQEWTY
ncbi:uncharacterized protein LOC133284858 isoform X2 [Gastrolobium bilobum]|uniref:uncharacterized protein LOC133284858 isoform X2 n=1 Tax=Gastrolobium bilobum TaxID=150636 RepID=UPI002AB2E36F|nr:uncharacterized protein LOC133284858 isoform X2 [Gastrolobium bilobum]